MNAWRDQKPTQTRAGKCIGIAWKLINYARVLQPDQSEKEFMTSVEIVDEFMGMSISALGELTSVTGDYAMRRQRFHLLIHADPLPLTLQMDAT